MFDKYKLTKDLRLKYVELFETNNEIKKIEKDFIKFCKNNKVLKKNKLLKNAIIRLIRRPHNLYEVNKLKGNMRNIKNSLLEGNNKVEEDKLYKTIIDDIYIKFNDRKYDYILSPHGDIDGLYLPNLFNLLIEIPNINKFSNTSDNHKGLINKMLDEIKTSDIKEEVLIYMILLKNIKNITELEDKYEFLSNIIYTLNIADSEIKYKQLSSLFGTFWQNNMNLEENNLKNNINIIIDEINTNYNDLNKEIYLDDLIKNIISIRKILNIDSKTLEVVIDKIKNYTEYNENKKKNIEYILYQLIYKEEFTNLSSELQIKLINTIMNLELTNEDTIDLINKVINDIILNSDSNEIINYTIDKLNQIKSSKSLELLNDIYPFIKKYSNDDEIINVINTVDNTNKVKKLVINLKE